jgi:hypothetical protein
MSKSRQSTSQRILSTGESAKSQIISNPKLPKEIATFPESSPEKSEERVKPILDFQEMAPAPSQTYYQIAVYPYKSREKRREKKSITRPSSSPLSKVLPELTHEKLERGCVIIREWPRKRYSIT